MKDSDLPENRRKNGVTIRPGVLEMLREAKAKGLKIASVSSTLIEVLKAALQNLAPDAKKVLGLSNPIVFKDTQIFMEAAVRAGIPCVAAPSE